MSDITWAKEAIFYHIYPIGLCGAPRENKGDETKGHRITEIEAWIPHLQELGVTAVYFGPLWESGTHGYDTFDYYKLDSRLGDNSDFKRLCHKLHEAGIRIVLDGVFNHIGRGHFALKDVIEKRHASPYKDWISGINFDWNNSFNDGLHYDSWQGHEELVKLNLYNPEVRKHLLDAIDMWIREFDIDGLRLDAADCIQKDFFKELRWFCKNKKDDFWLMGEIIHGDYKLWANNEMMDTVTNYECWKGIYSSLNEKNYFEINYALRRQWGRGGIYRDINLYNFVDNHDVNRIASLLKEKDNIYNAYTMLFMMPGIPSIYYGSEWGIEGVKNVGDVGDYPLRPAIKINEMANEDLIEHIKKLSEVRRTQKALVYGDYEEVIVRNEQLVFARPLDSSYVLCALNCTQNTVHMSFNYRGDDFNFDLEPFAARIFLQE